VTRLNARISPITVVDAARIDTVETARRLLSASGFPTDELEPVESVANRVWMTHKHVVRISSGRFRNSLVHEQRVLALLPESVPHANVAAAGQMDDREWQILERIPGVPLLHTWLRLDQSRRRRAIAQLAEIMRALHRAPLPEGFHNPWLEDALRADGHPENALHAPPHQYRLLIEAARRLPWTDAELVSSVESFIAERLDAFAGDVPVLVHTDLHFANLLWHEDGISGVIDFEGAQPQAADMELDTILRFTSDPRQSLTLGQHTAPTAAPTAASLAEVPVWLDTEYPELVAHPHFAERLDVYEALWHLVQLHHAHVDSSREGRQDRLAHLIERPGRRFQRLSSRA